MKYSSLQRDLFQLQRDLQHRIVAVAGLRQHRVTHLLHDLGARIVVLVDAMAEAHQADFAVLVLHLLDEVRNLVDRADLGQHRQRRLVGAAMGRSPQAGDAGGDAGERIGAGGAGDPHRRGRGVLLVVGMQDEDLVERVGQHRIDLVFLAGHREAHVAGSSRQSSSEFFGYTKGWPMVYLNAIAASVGIFAIIRIEAIMRCVGSLMSVES